MEKKGNKRYETSQEIENIQTNKVRKYIFLLFIDHINTKIK